MNPRYPRVATRALHRCEYCHAPESLFNFAFEVEHVIPVAEVGDDEEPNLALACRSCNIHKAQHLTGRDSSSGELVRVFNPRADRWVAHFVIETETAAIVGITPFGRATVSCLNINSGAQISARKQWIKLGLYP